MGKLKLSILVDNTPGVLSRVSGLFSRRGYNIDSFSAGVTQNPAYSRMTIVVTGEELILEQIEKQLAKLEDVREIIELIDDESVCRELILVKVKVPEERRQGVVAIANIFRANIIDVSVDSLIVELTGNQSKLDAFTKLLDGYEIVQLVRTGATGLVRGTSYQPNYIND